MCVFNDRENAGRGRQPVTRRCRLRPGVRETRRRAPAARMREGAMGTLARTQQRADRGARELR